MKLFIVLLIIGFPYCSGEGWTVYVHTGNERFAGTDSNVYIRLFNSNGHSTKEHQLTHENWMPENGFPVRNLFERNAKERFDIDTEDIGPISDIQIRHNNFPAWQADWLLDRVIIRNNRDNKIYTFLCNCWLRERRPYIKLHVDDPNVTDKNKTNDSSSKYNRTFVTILVLTIGLLIGFFCCYNEYRRRQRQHLSSYNNTIEQIQGDSTLLEQYHTQSADSSEIERQNWFNTLLRWKNHRLNLSSNNHTQIAHSGADAPVAAVNISNDAPPAYEDLYPNSISLMNASANSNL